MFDTNEATVVDALSRWGEGDDNIRSLILTSSRVNNLKKADKLSDFDIEVIVQDTMPFLNDEWLSVFGDVLIKWPLKPQNTGYATDSITRLVVFRNFPRVDFQIISENCFDGKSYDNGYRLLVDKDNYSERIPNPTFEQFIINKPTEDEFYATIDGFYWDIPYIAKSLRRGEISFAKYMLQGAIRYESFERMLGWYVGSKNSWTINLGVHGRNLEKLVNIEFTEKINSLNPSNKTDEIWQTTLEMVSLFEEMSNYLSDELGYHQAVVDKNQILQMCHKMLELPM